MDEQRIRETDVPMAEVPWSGVRCVLCTLPKPLTLEHIIPESLGGILECKFLCSDCNSKMGEFYEGGLLDSPEFRLAIEPLQAANPKLYRQMAGQRGFILDGPGGPVRAILRNGRLTPERMTDVRGSEKTTTFQSVSDLKRALREAPAAYGVSGDEIESAIQRISGAPEDTRVELTPGVEFANWRPQTSLPDLSAPFADPRIGLKIAYEFLALYYGEQVFHESLQDARDCLLSRSEILESLKFEELHAREYAPFHSIRLDTSCSGTRVTVRLFGYLVWRVTFPGEQTSAPQFIGYRVNLIGRKHYLAVSD